MSDVNYAGFWRRVLAAIVDSLILLVPMIAVMYVFGILDGLFESPDTRAPLPLGFVVFSLVVGWGYKALLESSAMQATPGKMALGLRVTDLEGGRLSLGTATLRSWPWWLGSVFQLVEGILGMSSALSTIVSFAGLISVVVVAFTARKQGVHDLIAKALVLRRAAA